MFYLYAVLRMPTYLHFHENVGIHINILNGFKKAMVLMRWMKLEPIIQSEVSQKEKHRYSIVTHIYGI